MALSAMLGGGSDQRGRRLLWAFVVAFCAAVIAWGIARDRIDADVAAYAGLEADRELSPVLRGIATSELARSVVIVVERLDAAGRVDRAASRADAAALAETLAQHPSVAWVRAGPDPAMRDAFHALYWPRRMALREEDVGAVDAAFSEEGLRAAADAMIDALRGPTSALVSRIAIDDPLLAYPALLRRFERAAAGSLEVDGGGFVTAHGAAVILLASRASPFDRASQGPLEAALEAEIAVLRRRTERPLIVRRSGVGRFAVAAETRIRRESTVLSTLGLAGVILTLVLIFGRVRAVVAAILPLAFALLAGAATTLLVFGRIHALTLGFGGMLVGVVVDYPLHLAVHHALAARRPSGFVARGGVAPAVRAGILLGAATTVVGFAGLAGATYPGLRELAVFATAGVIAAVAVTLLVLPSWLEAERTRPVEALDSRPLIAPLGEAGARGAPAAPHRLVRLHGVLARALCRAVSSPRARLGAATGLICSVVFIAAVAPRIQFVDDAEALSRVSPTWLLEDQLVRGAVGRFDAARFVVVQADTVEAALERNDAVARALEEARATGVIAEYRSLHAFLWSEAVQRRNLDALRSALQDRLVVRLRGAFSDAGLRGDAFAVGWDEQQAPLDDEGSVLRWSDLVGSPLAPLVSPFVIELEQGHGVAMTSYVRGVSDLERLRSIVEAVDGARLFDRRASMRAAWRAHRQQIGRVAGLGLVGVTLLVLLRHRQIGKTIRAVAPALLAAAFTLCVRSLVGPSLHLLDVIAALLVLSMGADYGVFLVEGSTASAAAAQGELGSERDADAATLLAMMLAFATTTWGFGTLALATNPAMQAIGLTTAIGVASALVFAVLVHVVAAGWPAPPHGSRASADRPPSRAARGRSSTLLMGVLLCGAAACAGPAGARARRTTSPEGPVDPEALPFDAALRQTVSATRDRDTRSLEVALEIRRERVVLVGVLPFGGRVFTIVATRAGVDTTVHLPGHVPIDARLVFDDMARALLVDARRVWSGPPPRRGVRRGHAALGDFEERWQDGCVVSRRFVGRDPLAITYDDPWCTGALPRRLRLERPRIGLTIRVETLAGEIEARAP